MEKDEKLLTAKSAKESQRTQRKSLHPTRRIPSREFTRTLNRRKRRDRREICVELPALSSRPLRSLRSKASGFVSAFLCALGGEMFLGVLRYRPNQLHKSCHDAEQQPNNVEPRRMQPFIQAHADE